MDEVNDPLSLTSSQLGRVWPPRPPQKLPAYDARDVALRRLRDFLSLVEFQRAASATETTPFRLPKASIFIYQPDDIVKAPMPAIGIVPSLGTHETYGLGPPELLEHTVDMFGPGTALLRQSDYVETFTLEVWGSKQAERRALVAGLLSILRQNDESYALRLTLPDYYNQVASFELNESQYIDGDEVASNRRRAFIMLKLTVAEVTLVNVVKQLPAEVQVQVFDTTLEFDTCCAVPSGLACSCCGH